VFLSHMYRRPKRYLFSVSLFASCLLLYHAYLTEREQITFASSIRNFRQTITSQYTSDANELYTYMHTGDHAHSEYALSQRRP